MDQPQGSEGDLKEEEEAHDQPMRRVRPLEAAAGRNLSQQTPFPKPCPRCNSANTKFCYYNNYSLSQPRYFCKSCRRYWTHGGSLRNVPVGGGCRKSKRSKPSFAAEDGGEMLRARPSSPAFIPTRDPMGMPPVMAASLAGPLYSSGSGQFLSSLAGFPMQSLMHQPPVGINHGLTRYLGASSHFGEWPAGGDGGVGPVAGQQLFQPVQNEFLLPPSNPPMISSWPNRSIMNNLPSNIPANTTFWSGTGDQNIAGCDGDLAGSSSSNPYQWSDLNPNYINPTQ